jgi:hypothetical protein
LLFHKYFNDAWAIGLCFATSPRDPFTISVHHTCFTLVTNEWMLFY